MGRGGACKILGLVHGKSNYGGYVLNRHLFQPFLLTKLTFQLHPACISNKVFLIDHNMPKGEYFLVEYRSNCGFDSELRYHSEERGRDRSGMALWHVDESGLMAISYTTEGYPGDGKNPRKHYKVALAQADGEWDLEKGRNRGDSTDLFRRSDDPWQAQTAYKITPQGLVLNNGQLKAGVNTNSYANNGNEKDTGITIEVGLAGSSMTMEVTLDGAPKPQPTLPPTTRPPTTRPPTPYPTPNPTPKPNPQPTLQYVGRNMPTPPTTDIPRQCLGKPGKRICFTGIGRKPNKYYNKNCSFIVKKKLQNEVCDLPDLLQPGKTIRDSCKRACK